MQRRERAESALITVVADCYLAGVSTRRMDKLVKTLGIDSLSKSQVARMATDLDEHVAQFRHHPGLDRIPGQQIQVYQLPSQESAETLRPNPGTMTCSSWR